MLRGLENSSLSTFAPQPLHQLVSRARGYAQFTGDFPNTLSLLQ